VLGDRARMGAHTGEPGVFIRSMATRGHLGGLARATADAALVLDAAGADIVLIETVGVGQDEVDVASTADASIVVLVPGTGDELQAIKAGVMEIGDIFVVNKADREGAERAVQAVSASLALRTYDPGEWIPPVLTTQAISDVGVDALWAEIGRFRQWASARHRARRRTRQAARLRDLLAASFLREVDSVIEPAEFERVVDAVESRGSDPYSAAAGLMRRVLREARPPGRESE
jgi:LAO/AO transport system kinase